jgi:hypothetical protein
MMKVTKEGLVVGVESTVYFCDLKIFLKEFYFNFFLFKINKFLVFLYHFNMLILKIIFFILIYFKIKNTLKKITTTLPEPFKKALQARPRGKYFTGASFHLSVWWQSWK